MLPLRLVGKRGLWIVTHFDAVVGYVYHSVHSDGVEYLRTKKREVIPR